MVTFTSKINGTTYSEKDLKVYLQSNLEGVNVLGFYISEHMENTTENLVISINEYKEMLEMVELIENNYRPDSRTCSYTRKLNKVITDIQNKIDNPIVCDFDWGNL